MPKRSAIRDTSKSRTRGNTTGRKPTSLANSILQARAFPITERPRPDSEIKRLRQARIRAYVEKREALKKLRATKELLGVLAEGDSWFDYPKSLGTGGSIIDHLQRMVQSVILNLAVRGDDVRLMLSLPQRIEITQRFADGVPNEGRPYDIFLFSGGGNDLVGNQFCIWLKDYKAGMKATDIIDSVRLNAVLEIVEAGYRDLLEIRNAESHATKAFLHTYDYAIPDGRGVCGYGPWLKPSLDFRGVPPSLQRDVVKEMLLRFDRKVRQVATAYKEVYVVPTQGTLKDDEWSNEIHPDRDGFDKLAEKFATALRARVPET